MSALTWVLDVPSREKLIKAAFEAKEFAYSKYSKFRVGAALLTPDGQIIKGANIENASYGGTICAERTAFVKAVSEGTMSFVALAVVTDVASPLSPCGMCRQQKAWAMAFWKPALQSFFPIASGQRTWSFRDRVQTRSKWQE
ncbi:unnamed protein product [Somion occarium]|uniref:CMP/dCMP-type deaminase domain-containing protein n=1 Tax=Somion occarium TaxID=3059160 RepID=A0ABP1E307_9APHY